MLDVENLQKCGVVFSATRVRAQNGPFLET